MYSVSESDGEVAVVVQHMIIPVPELTQPIVFMVSCSDGNATGTTIIVCVVLYIILRSLEMSNVHHAAITSYF